MIVTADVCESLNSQLNLLSKGGFEGFQPDEFQSTELSEQYLSVCNALINELLKPDMQISYSTIDEIVTALNRPLFFHANAEGVKYKLLHYLCSAVQSERLRLLKTVHSNPTGRGRLVFQLDKICKVLNIQTTDLQNETDVIDQIYHTVSTLFDKSENTELLKHPSKILAHIRTLNEDQIRLTNSINEAYYADFQLRRQMLLKRLDVTIQSFLWSQKAGFDEVEIKKAINSQLQFLSEKPRLFTVQDALAAPFALIHEHAKKVTGSVASASGNKSIVKQIIIGKVPDRGGRANEMRPKHFEVAGGYKGKNSNFKKGNGGGGNNNMNNSNTAGAKDDKGSSNSGNNQKGDGKGKGGGGDQKQGAAAAAVTSTTSNNSKSGNDKGTQQQGSKQQLQQQGKNNSKSKSNSTGSSSGGPSSSNNPHAKSGRVVTVSDTQEGMDVVSPEVAALLAANEGPPAASPATGSQGGKGNRNNHHNKKPRNK